MLETKLNNGLAWAEKYSKKRDEKNIGLTFTRICGKKSRGTFYMGGFNNLRWAQQAQKSIVKNLRIQKPLHMVIVDPCFTP